MKYPVKKSPLKTISIFSVPNIVRQPIPFLWSKAISQKDVYQCQNHCLESIKYVPQAFFPTSSPGLSLKKMGGVHPFLREKPWGRGCYFHENFRCNLTYYEGENFSNSSFHHIFESEIFRFPFFYEKQPNFRKSQVIYEMSFENCT